MCNEVARRISLDLLRNDFDQRKIRLFTPENAPNMEPLPSIRITDSTVIVRAAVGSGGFGSEAGVRGRAFGFGERVWAVTQVR